MLVQTPTHTDKFFTCLSLHIQFQGKYCDKSTVQPGQKRKDKCSGLRRSETCINLLTIHIRLSYSYTHASVVIVDGSHPSFCFILSVHPIYIQFNC